MNRAIPCHCPFPSFFRSVSSFTKRTSSRFCSRHIVKAGTSPFIFHRYQKLRNTRKKRLYMLAVHMMNQENDDSLIHSRGQEGRARGGGGLQVITAIRPKKDSVFRSCEKRVMIFFSGDDFIMTHDHISCFASRETPPLDSVKKAKSVKGTP